jgi:2-amino-4-hydroxy-6-hydroxymethyldihydropteridine diphosphokinase/dihydropteroate synthase
MIILGIGSNLDDRLDNMRKALRLLSHISELSILQVAPVYQSDAMLPVNFKPEWNMPFLNTAVSCETSLSPLQLLNKLKKIEKQIGRPDDYEKWSPRLIDIDILTWHNEIINQEQLNIPQKDLINRPFAMWPIADLNPNWQYLLPEENAQGQLAKEIVARWDSRFTGEKAPFNTKQIAHRIDGAQIVGVLNITPDSFSDGGEFADTEKAVMRTSELFYAGADIIDIGAESARPRGTAITSAEEWLRLEKILPTILDFWHDKNFKPKISIDTRRAEIAAKVIAMGVDWINDVEGFKNKKMREVVKDADVKLVFMHSLTTPVDPAIILNSHKDVIMQINDWAIERMKLLESSGIDRARLIFDPGVGFGKDAPQSLEIIKRCGEFHNLDLPILIGHSRKSFMNDLTYKPYKDRDLETVAINAYLERQKIDYIRVHDADFTMRAKRITQRLK